MPKRFSVFRDHSTGKYAVEESSVALVGIYSMDGSRHYIATFVLKQDAEEYRDFLNHTRPAKDGM